jgi:hypothetical protein
MLPFLGSEAIAAGALTAGQLRGARWRRIFRDVYVASAVPDSHLLRCQAMALRLPDGAVITGRSAAEVWGVRLADAAEPVEVLTPRRMRQVAGSLIRVGQLDADEIVSRLGVPVPSRLHTAWELARTLPLMDAVPRLDALARLTRATTGDLLAHAARHRGEVGSVPALEALRLCDWRAESPPESIVRLSLILGGLPAPIPQFRVVIDGQFLARVDLAYPSIRLALEYDGQWHADRDQLTRDRRRIRNLNAAGWYVYPITRHDLRDLDVLVEAVRELIARRTRIL